MTENEQDDLKRYAGGIIRRMIKEGQPIDLKKVKDIVKKKMGADLSDQDLEDVKSRMTRNSGGTKEESTATPLPSTGKSASPIETLAAYLNKKKADAIIIYASGKYSIWRKASDD